ncbi:uncharacterized protein LOC124110924 [Haliotis rufescens]|uniref:uncharacterized protein LOC124110924 n=1 Tax=Haliotis rufescens TaxID=6454 RepID=UPI001EB08327|nr:uncharacterized protein LOC124110924 [Haliotis rufescens]
MMTSMISCFEKKQDHTISILNAIEMVHRAWRQVNATSIKNCFRKGGFVLTDGVAESDSESDDIPLSDLRDVWAELKNVTDIPSEMTLQEFIDADRDILVAERPSDDDIIQSIVDKRDGTSRMDSDNEEMQDGIDFVEPAQPSFANANKALEILKLFLNTQKATDMTSFDSLADLNDAVSAKRGQSKITDYASRM